MSRGNLVLIRIDPKHNDTLKHFHQERGLTPSRLFEIFLEGLASGKLDITGTKKDDRHSTGSAGV